MTKGIHSSDRLDKDQSKQNPKRLDVLPEQPFQKAISIYNHRSLCIGTADKAAPKRTWSVNPLDYRIVSNSNVEEKSDARTKTTKKSTKQRNIKIMR